MSTTKHRTPLDTKTRHGIPVPTVEPNSLRDSVIALRSAVEELTRQRGDMLDSALTVKDLVKLGVISPEAVELMDKGGAYYRLQSVAGMSQAHQGFGPIGSGSGTTTIGSGGGSFSLDEFDIDWLLSSITEDHLSPILLDKLALIALLQANLAQEVANRRALIADLQAQLDVDVANLQAEVTARQAQALDLQNELTELATDFSASVFVQPEPPVPGVAGVPAVIPNGARWYDSDDGNHAYIWDGTLLQWVSLMDPRIGQNAADITALQVSLSNAEDGILANATALSVLDTTVSNLNGVVTSQSTAITTLQAEVDLRSTVFMQPAPPTANNIGDLWIDTDDGNKLYRWDGLAWVPARDAGIAGNATAISGLDTRVTNAENEFTAIATDISTLQTGLTTVQGTASANSVAITGLTSRVTAAEGIITSQASDITSLQSTVTQHTTDITGNATAIGGLDTRVTAAEGSITSQASDITSLQTSLTTAEGDILANASALTSLDSRVTITETTVASYSSAITALEANIADLQLNEYLQTAVSGNAAAIQSLEAKVTYSEGEISSIASDISALQTSVALLEGGQAALDAVAALEVRVTANETDITAISSDIVSLQGSVTSIDGQVGTNASAISALDIRMTSAEGVNTAQASDITSLTTTVSLKSRTFAQPAAPTATAVGDLWIDTDDSNKLYRWDGAAWISVRDTVSDSFATAIGGLDTRVTATENSITAQASDITALQSSLGTVTGDVAANATAIGGLDTRVSSAEGTITTQASNITSLQTSVNLKNRTFAQANTPVATATGDLWIETDNNNKVWRWNGTAWIGLDNPIIGANATAIGGLDTRVLSAEGTISAHATAITNLQSNVTTINGTLAGQATAIGGLTTDVTAIEGDITALSANFTSLSTTVGGHTTNISTLTSTTNGLSAQYTVKVDNNNGYVAGFGLASTPINGTPISTFAVLADKFIIAHPGMTPVVPFLVSGGIVYMQNIRVGNAVIDDLSVGKLTTGSLNAPVTQNADWFVGTGRIVWDNGNFIKAAGIGFGSTNQFIEWFGPRPTGGNLALCTEANAISYLKTNGAAYFGGSLSAGTLKNAAQSTSTAGPTIDVSIGPFGSNGNQITVVGSYNFDYFWVSAPPASGTPTAQFKLYRKKGSGAKTLVYTANFSGNTTSIYNEGSGMYQNRQTINGSVTYVDPDLSTDNRTYWWELSARLVNGVTNQTFGLISTEE